MPSKIWSRVACCLSGWRCEFAGAMQHKDYQTTQRYINMARQLNPAPQNLFVPHLQAKKASILAEMPFGGLWRVGP